MLSCAPELKPSLRPAPLAPPRGRMRMRGARSTGLVLQQRKLLIQPQSRGMRRVLSEEAEHALQGAAGLETSLRDRQLQAHQLDQPRIILAALELDASLMKATGVNQLADGAEPVRKASRDVWRTISRNLFGHTEV